MPNYRIYEMSHDGVVVSGPHLIETANDLDAVKKARQLHPSRHIEIWDGERRITRIPLISNS